MKLTVKQIESIVRGAVRTKEVDGYVRFYRFTEEQEELYREDPLTATVPGASEHQTGLAVDITDRYYEIKDSSIENTETFKWLKEHCAEYGFILRFPKGKEDITQVVFEPWHFRYVGKQAAAEIMAAGITLEEYLGVA